MGRIKLEPEDVKLIKELCEMNRFYDREIAKMFGVSRGHITKIRNKKRWNYEYGKESKDNQKEAIAFYTEYLRRAGIHGKAKA